MPSKTDCIRENPYNHVFGFKMAASGFVEARSYKEEGNKLFRAGKFEDAISKYSLGIDECPSNKEGLQDVAVLRKNRAACLLKLKKFDEAILDCSAVLTIVPSDTKALYRLAQAQEGKGDDQEALGTLRKLLSIDPKNSEVQQFASRLTTKLKQTVDRLTTTDGLVREMCSVLLEGGGKSEKRIQAAKNLAILSRESAGAERILIGDGLKMVLQLLEDTSNEVAVHSIQTLIGVCQQNANRTLAVMKEIALEKVVVLLQSDKEKVSTSIAELMQTMVCAVTEEPKVLKPGEIKSDTMSLTPVQLSVIMPITTLLLHHLIEISVSAVGRDAILEYFVKTTQRRDVGKVYLKEELIPKLLHVAANTSDVSLPLKPLPVSGNTRLNVSVTLSELHKSLGILKKKELEAYAEQCGTFIIPMLKEQDRAAQIRGMTALCALLQGCVEIGNSIFSNEFVLSTMVSLAQSTDPQCQIVAAEALALAASDKNRCSAIMAEGLDIMKSLYESTYDEIRVRALVGLCKLGSTGGWNVKAKTLPSGSMLELYDACCKFLVADTKEVNIQRWCTEGIAFLSMDAEVKEKLIKDPDTLRHLFFCGSSSDQALLYGLSSILVNLTNSYDKLEKTEETEQLEQLSKYAGEQLPEEHKLDGEEYVKKRVVELISQKVIPLLAKLSECASHKVREQVSRVFLALVTDVENRGLVVQQGGSKCLLPLALSSTDTGKFIASQALAKIGITTNPELAFPGQRMLEVVRPLCAVLKSQKGLQQFEGLMALTNLCAVSEDVRKRIVKEKGIQQIETLMFEEHELIRRAATEAMCNMVQSEQVAERFLSDDVERVKLITLFAGEDDVHLARAASGTLCQLSVDPRICKKIMDVKQAVEIFKEMIARDDDDLRYRSLFIIANIVESDAALAEKVLDDDMMTILNGFLHLESTSDKVKTCAARSLEKAVAHGIIKPTTA